MYKLYSGTKMIKRKEQETQKNRKQFTITKKIAKHGSQAIIVIPRILETQLKPGTIVEIKLNVLVDEK